MIGENFRATILVHAYLTHKSPSPFAKLYCKKKNMSEGLNFLKSSIIFEANIC